jgi:hypothetical protein
VQRAVVGGGRFAEYEELYEEEDQEGDGELAKEEALCEGETVGLLVGRKGRTCSSYEDVPGISGWLIGVGSGFSMIEKEAGAIDLSCWWCLEKCRARCLKR